jgi:hypothetical protein
MYKDSWMPAEWGMPDKAWEVEWCQTTGEPHPFIACLNAFPVPFKHAEWKWRPLEIKRREEAIQA